MDAGSVPRDWRPPLGDDTELPQEMKRYCKVCKDLKPPRSHHCGTCKRCVLRMDHHCPWIANCVGQKNYASFMRFLAAVDVTCAGHLILCGLRVADYWWTKEGAMWRPPSTFTMVMLILNFALCIPTFALVGSFSIYHFWCLCTNTTTIEGWERDKVERLINKGRIEEVDYPFDLGVIRNLQSVLGRSPITWCIPSTTCGDGLHYEVTEGLDDLVQYLWPPKDPTRESRDEGKMVKLSRNGPFTYGNNGFNPALRPNNTASSIKASALPPWHPDYGKPDEEDLEEEEEDAAQESGVDTGETCLPPGMASGSSGIRKRIEKVIDGNDQAATDDEEGETSAPLSSLVRRGSEGYEVRPRQYDLAYAAENPSDGYELNHEGYNDYDDYDDYDDDDEENDPDGRIWDWKRQKEEEDRLREMLEEEMRKTGETALPDPPADWQMPNEGGKGEGEGEGDEDDAMSSSAVLLPSQVMRRRNQWQQYNQASSS